MKYKRTNLLKIPHCLETGFEPIFCHFSLLISLNVLIVKDNSPLYYLYYTCLLNNNYLYLLFIFCLFVLDNSKYKYILMEFDILSHGGRIKYTLVFRLNIFTGVFY